MIKEKVVCDYYEDGVLKTNRDGKRNVYEDKKGRHVKDGDGRKRYLDENNHYKNECVTIGKSISFAEMIEEVKRKNEEALTTYKNNDGMCQNCGKNKAEFPNGLDPFCCKECNDATQKLVDQLSKNNPGFVHFRV